MLIDYSDSYYNCCFKYNYNIMNMRRNNNDDDNNIKYIHKPTTVIENDPLTLIGITSLTSLAIMSSFHP